MATIRITIPHHLRNLAGTGAEVTVDVDGPVTQRSVMDALEAKFPVLKGTIREHGTKERRAYVRFFANMDDISHDSPDDLLPDEVASGAEPLRVIGAISGG